MVFLLGMVDIVIICFTGCIFLENMYQLIYSPLILFTIVVMHRSQIGTLLCTVFLRKVIGNKRFYFPLYSQKILKEQFTKGCIKLK